jgi:hypothetical protein
MQLMYFSSLLPPCWTGDQLQKTYAWNWGSIADNLEMSFLDANFELELWEEFLLFQGVLYSILAAANFQDLNSHTLRTSVMVVLSSILSHSIIYQPKHHILTFSGYLSLHPYSIRKSELYSSLYTDGTKCLGHPEAWNNSFTQRRNILFMDFDKSTVSNGF